MPRLKPTTIIALDPHTAALCDAVRERLKRGYGERGGLIQVTALVCDGSSLRFDENLASIADSSFDLESARKQHNRMKPAEAGELFNNSRVGLEPGLIKMLSAARRAEEIEAAQRAGIEIIGPQMIYLAFSASDPFASGVGIEMATLIRWLFATYFNDDSFTLQAIVLLPSLFRQAEADNFASAYALLKKLDYAADNGIIIVDPEPKPPFDYCWLVDSRNARGDEIGLLATNIESYSDSLAGFLTAEPEMCGAMVGTHKVRGKVQAYSAFGHGELYFPADLVITRLSAALASDILERAYLAGDDLIADQRRMLLLGAKQFVLSPDFVNALESLEKQVWQNFDPKLDVREGREDEYTRELRRKSEQFESESLLKYRETLESRREPVRKELIALLDAEIDRRADINPSGLAEALELLDILMDRAIALQGHVLGDAPLNLITEKRSADCALDSTLEFAPDDQRTEALLEEIGKLRSELGNLQTTLRLIPADEVEQSDSSPELKSENEPSGERQSVIEDIKKIEERLTEAEEEYRAAILDEEKAATVARFEATKTVRQAKAQAIVDAESRVSEIAGQLRATQQQLETLREQRQAFVQRYFVFYPVAALMVLFALPALLAAADIGPARTLINFYMNNLSTVIFYAIIGAVIYYAVMGIKFASGINRQVKQVEQQVNLLKDSLKAASVELRRAHNNQLRLEYQLHAQRIRVDMIVNLVEAARRKAGEIKEKIAELSELHKAFNKQRDEAVPYYSMLRRSAVGPSDIDSYYNKTFSEPTSIAKQFREMVKPSQLRRMPIEEFRSKLDSFAQKQFSRITELSIEDVLLRERDLVSTDGAIQRLRELDAASQPLVRLTDMDANRATTQRDATIWAGVGEHQELATLYSKIRQDVSLKTHEDERSIRALSRFLHFPAYFLSQIQYYRHCYLAVSDKEVESLPELIPSEFGVDGAVKRAQERFLLATALGLVEQREDGGYYFGDRVALGTSRGDIARKLATDLSSRQVYSEISAAVDKQSSDRDLTYRRLSEFLVAAANLESDEQETLNSLMQKFHPLT